ncbi:MAG: hypothetical protein RIC95_12260 [Vicingaceae bacterium]
MTNLESLYSIMPHLSYYSSLHGIFVFLAAALSLLSIPYILNNIKSIRLSVTTTYLFLIFLASLFAIYQSHFKTSLLVVPLLSFFTIYFLNNKQNSFEKNKSSLPIFLTSIIVLLFIYTYHFTRLDNFLAPNMHYVDQLFYGRLASYLRDYGIESSVIDYFQKIETSDALIPYHYIEHWIAAMISKTFSVHSMFALNGVLYPLIYSLISVSLLLLVKKLRPIKLTTKNLISLVMISFSMLFISIPDLGALLNIEFLGLSSWIFPLYGYHKTAFISILLILQLKQLLNRNWIAFCLIALLMVISNVAISFSVFGATLLLFLALYIKRRISLRTVSLAVGLLISLGIYLLIFYNLFGFSSENSVAPSSADFVTKLSEFSFWTTAFNIFIKSTLQCAFSLLPFAILLFIVHRYQPLPHKVQILFLYLAFLFFTGLLTYSALHFIQDAEQFWSISASLTLHLFAALTTGITLSIIMDRSKWVFYMIVPLISLFFFLRIDSFYHPNKVEIQNETTLFKAAVGSQVPRFAFLKSKEDYQFKNQQYESIYFGQLYQLANKFDPLMVICLSVDQIPEESQEEAKYNSFLQFNRYIKAKGLESRLVETQQLSFLSDYDIDYLLVSENSSLPSVCEYFFYIDPVGTIDGYRLFKSKPRE